MTVGAFSSRKKKNKILAKLPKHKIKVLAVLLGVEVEGNMLGHVDNLKYVDHDVQDIAKLPDFAKEKYMVANPQPGELWCMRGRTRHWD